MEIAVGEFVYSKQHELGAGAQGAVYKGHYMSDQKKLVAVKEVKVRKDVKFNELDILQKCKEIESKNIIKLLHSDVKDNRLILVTEFCDGGSLKNYIEENGVLSYQQTWTFMRQFANGLKALIENQLIHRDLKPDNLLLVKNKVPKAHKDYLTLKIADMGLARVLPPGAFAETFCGTVPYMAPEIVLEREYDAKVDIWSFGIIAHECCTDKHPLPDVLTCKDFRELRWVYQDEVLIMSLEDTLPSELKDLLTKILIVSAEKRIDIEDFFSHEYFTKPPTDSTTLSTNAGSVQGMQHSTLRRQTVASTTSHNGATVLSINNVTITNQSIRPRMGLFEEKLLKEYDLHFSTGGGLRNAKGEKFQYDVHNGDKAKNQARYEEIGELINGVIYEKLEQEGLEKYFIPQGAGNNEDSGFVFISNDVFFNIKQIIIIQGSGAVRAGQWSRNLIMNESIENGSMLPCVRRARKLGFSVVILNPNQNSVMKDGARISIPHSGNPLEHSNYVWETLIAKSRAKIICLVAHSYGGTIVSHLMQQHAEDFEKRVVAIALTDSTATDWPKGKLQQLMKERCREWVRSESPVGTVLSTANNIDDHDIEANNFDLRDSGISEVNTSHGGTLLSAGTSVHYKTTLCSIDEIFAFCKERASLALEA